jgi:hypothetical protein
MVSINPVLNLEQQFATVQDIRSEIHHYLRSPASIIVSSSYLLEAALTRNKKILKSPSEYVALIQDAAQCLETNCYQIIETINQVSLNIWAVNRIRFYLDRMIYFCQTILSNLECISQAKYHGKLCSEAEKAELIDLVMGLNQWAMQMTDLLSSECFYDYIQQFAENLFMKSQFKGLGEYQST